MRISRVTLAVSTLAIVGFGWAAAAQQKPASGTATSMVVYKSPT